MSELQSAIAIIKQKLTNAKRNISIAEMEAIWGVLAKAESEQAALQQNLKQVEAKLEAANAVKEVWKNIAWTAEEQLTEQQQKVDALAAENADLKHPGTYLPSKRDTPATDAILNVVRADAIRSALNSCSDRLDTDCVMEAHGISYEDAEMRTNGALELHNALLAVATELRASAAKDGK
ncbi:hypothetical protein [Bacillus altitudinis]|uniref:hypothetical protein n=1 Tax=Bacillus altitudinis TaxID=293387 RepID=UPI003671552C